MTTMHSLFLRESESRGMIHQGTNLEALDARLQKGPIVAYLGFDATAQSLHVGNLTQIMRLRLLQRTGHKPIVLMGGGTTKVGDPSGKEEMRQMLDADRINANVAHISKIFAKYLTFGDGPTDAVMVNNAAWLEGLNYLDFLGTYGRHFSINRMLTFDSVRQRLEREQPLSFLEFNYMILQAYDFLELNRRHKVELQLGGADQWGNIVSGIDLIRRTERVESFGLTSPLITTSSGAKMGKTAQGAVWLDETLLSPYDFWQFWRNTDDGDVGRFLRLFTDLSLEEIARLEALQGAEINEAKKVLADEATRLCHGDGAVLTARETAEKVFEQGAALDATLPSFEVTLEMLEGGYPMIDALTEAGLAPSKGEARRLIRGGGARLNDHPITDEAHALHTSDFVEAEVLKLSAGKKRHALVRLKK